MVVVWRGRNVNRIVLIKTNPYAMVKSLKITILDTVRDLKM